MAASDRPPSPHSHTCEKRDQRGFVAFDHNEMKPVREREIGDFFLEVLERLCAEEAREHEEKE